MSSENKSEIEKILQESDRKHTEEWHLEFEGYLMDRLKDRLKGKLQTVEVHYTDGMGRPGSFLGASAEGADSSANLLVGVSAFW